MAAGRLATRVCRNPGGYGVHGSVLVAGVEHSCGAVRGVASERAAHQSRAGPGRRTRETASRLRICCSTGCCVGVRAPATHAGASRPDMDCSTYGFLLPTTQAKLVAQRVILRIARDLPNNSKCRRLCHWQEIPQAPKGDLTRKSPE